MDDLIKRQGALDAIKLTSSPYLPELNGTYPAQVKALKELPSADAVEVVRCKDCKYKPVGTGCNHDIEFPVHYKCPCECEDYWYSWIPKDNFFCGNGERKETDG